MSLGNAGGGRPATPTAKLRVLGTYRPDRHAKRADASVEPALLPPPKHLDAAAKRRYNELGQYLLKQRIVTEADMGILAMYAQSWSNWVKASLQVREEEKCQQDAEAWWDSNGDDALEALEGRLRKLERRALGESPAVKQSREERLMLDRLGAQLGLSPVMRAKLHVEPEQPVKSAMSEFLSNG